MDRDIIGANFSRTLALFPAKENIGIFKNLVSEILEQGLWHGIS
jgi:hypothetical protein